VLWQLRHKHAVRSNHGLIFLVRQNPVGWIKIIEFFKNSKIEKLSSKSKNPMKLIGLPFFIHKNLVFKF
jgi:hypothetical protein